MFCELLRTCERGLSCVFCISPTLPLALASRIGLLLNGSKCQLLSIHSDMPVSLSLSVKPESACDCPHCAPFLDSVPNPDSFDEPLAPVPQAKHLGSCITPNSSSKSDASFRCSQASHAFKCLDSFFGHTLISPRGKLQVYAQIVQSIPSMVQHLRPTFPAQIRRIDSLH